MPPIPGDWIVSGGGYGLVAFAVFLVFMGWLVPRSQVRRLEAAMAHLEQERDQWRMVAFKAMGHSDMLMPAAQVATEVLSSFAEQTEHALKGFVAEEEQE